MSPTEVGLSYESVKMVTGNNVQLDGWLIPAR